MATIPLPPSPPSDVHQASQTDLSPKPYSPSDPYHSSSTVHPFHQESDPFHPEPSSTTQSHQKAGPPKKYNN